jgi:hypothetical protein
MKVMYVTNYTGIEFNRLSEIIRKHEFGLNNDDGSVTIIEANAPECEPNHIYTDEKRLVDLLSECQIDILPERLVDSLSECQIDILPGGFTAVDPITCKEIDVIYHVDGNNNIFNVSKYLKEIKETESYSVDDPYGYYDDDWGKDYYWDVIDGYDFDLEYDSDLEWDID